MFGCNESITNDIIYLKNDCIKIGVLNSVGGRLVYLSHLEQDNILNADEKFWNISDDERINPSPFTKFKAYNGMITWVGPQSEWWTDQDVNPELLLNKSRWPPDPFLIYGDFEIIKKTDSSITLIGPNSPVSGVRLTKEYSIKSNKLTIKVTARNIRDRDISFDLWTNARFDSTTDFIIPAFTEDLLKVESKATTEYQKLESRTEEGFFYFLKEPMSKGDKPRVGKAFLHPEKGNIIAVRGKTFLLMDFDFVSRDKIHPDQAFIECYNKQSDKKEDCLLELEHHSEYKTLRPGESSIMVETWSLFEYMEPKDHRDYYRFYKIIQSKYASGK